MSYLKILIFPSSFSNFYVIKNKKNSFKQDKGGEKITIDANYVKDNVNELSKDTDLSKFIL